MNKELIYEISAAKNEPAWMTEHRIKSFEIFEKWHEPNWGVEKRIDLSKIVPYVKPNAKRPIIGKKYRRRLRSHSTDLVFRGERKYLAGVGAQFDSEMIYKNIKEELKNLVSYSSI